MSVELEIVAPGHPPSRFKLTAGRYGIGRAAGNRIRLPHAGISERHASLCLSNNIVTLEDLGSSNGTWVNDSPISTTLTLTANDQIGIGPYRLRIIEPDATPAREPPGPSPDASSPPDGQAFEADAPPEGSRTAQPEPVLPPPDPARALRRQIKTQIHRELIQRLDLRRMTAARVNSDELQQRARETIDVILAEVAHRLPAGMDAQQLSREICDEALRLGPLEDYLADDTITEIMVNGPHQVYVEREGRIEAAEQDFMDDASVLAVIERIVAPLGRRIDESRPYVDARLPDGSRVNAIIHPLSLTGPCLTIRKFSRTPFTDRDMIRFGTLTPAVADFLKICVRLRKNIVVSGGTGSGKTTLLNVLSNYIPDQDRILTIEDAAELRLAKTHLVRLEARPPNIEGRGAITIRDLVRNALRMRPDRIIVGECRGGEALDMLQAMNTGHDGSLTTVHANAPRDVISRLETMVLMSGMDLPSRAIREQIASAIDIIVHEARFSDGSRKVASVTEVVGLEGVQTTMQDLFVFRQTGIDPEGRVIGDMHPTGAIPTFLQDLQSRGMTLDPAIFRPATEQAGVSSS